MKNYVNYVLLLAILAIVTFQPAVFLPSDVVQLPDLTTNSQLPQTNIYLKSDELTSPTPDPSGLGWNLGDINSLVVGNGYVSFKCVGISDDVIIIVENEPYITSIWTDVSGCSRAELIETKIYQPLKQFFGTCSKAFDNSTDFALALFDFAAHGEDAGGFYAGMSNGYAIIYLPYNSINDSTLAHELQHAINDNYRGGPGLGPDETWFNEGMAEIAGGLCGVRENGTRLAGWRSQASPTNCPLLYWDYNDNIGTRSNNYANAFAFVWYLGEHFGWSFLGEVMRGNETVIDTINSLLSQKGILKTFDEIFRDFTVASQIDRWDIAPEYGFRDFNLITMASNGNMPIRENQLPVNLTNWVFHRGSIAFDMNLWQTSLSSVDITFEGEDDGDFIIHTATYVYKSINDILCTVQSMILDVSTQAGKITVILPKNVMQVRIIVTNMKGDKSMDNIDYEYYTNLDRIRDHFTITTKVGTYIPSSGISNTISHETPGFLVFSTFFLLISLVITKKFQKYRKE